jgi:hypothetical protein
MGGVWWHGKGIRMKHKVGVFQEVEKALGKSLEETLKDMRKKGLSASQIYEEISQRTQIKFTKRSLERWLISFGIGYSRREAGLLRWQNGLMVESMKKGRGALQEASLIGSRIEEQIRWALKNDLEKFSDYEVIIGFSNWTILGNLEVDIPIVCILKSDQSITKFALEIDGDRFHIDESRWTRKERSIKQSGWHPLRIIIHEQELSRKAHQVYVKNNIRSLIDINGLVTEINKILNV